MFVKKFISIIIISYEQEDYIKRTVESILNQSIKGFDFEILLIDDASNDKTVEKVKELTNHVNYSKLRIVVNKENKGYRDNFIYAFTNIKGEYTAFCEGDDYWTDNFKLIKQFEILEKNLKIGLVYTDVSWINIDKNITIKDVLKNNRLRHVGEFEDHLINANYYAPLTWLFRSDLLDDINWDLITTDGTFNIMLHVLRKTSIYFLEDTTAVHRVSNTSISHNSNLQKNYLWRKGVFETQTKYAEDSNISLYSIELMYVKNYTYLLAKYAFHLKDDEFIKEAKLYLYKNNFANVFNAIKVEYHFSQEKNRMLFKFYTTLKKSLRLFKYFQ